MGMHVRGGSQWKQQTRRETSGPLRRACPASGATWNVQVVRGKMSTRCLWHACRALMVGILLMVIGASMATIGYYSQDFALGEFRHNTTIRVKNEQRGLHLNNLSYLGPIIMGVGGFIVVASCVMTFEARDSAAKVVPARFKLSTNSRGRNSGPGSRRTTTSVQSSDSRKTSTGQSGRWEQHLGLFKSSPGSDLPADRHALTAALIHFSRTLGSPKCIAQASSEFRRLSRSGSVPNLDDKVHITSPLLKSSGSPNTHRRMSRTHQNHHHPHHHNHNVKQHSSLVYRATRENSYLHPGLLRYHRHAISVDETSPLRQSNDWTHGSQASVTFDPTPEIIDIAPVHKKRIKHSDTSRRHILSRQKPIEKEEVHNSSPQQRRRSSTMSENSISQSRKQIASTTVEISRRASSASRTYSIDSRCYQHNANISSAHDLCRSPEKQQSPRKVSSILSIDKENFRSQLSICSEPMAAVKQLSCQSSIEPCLMEEESGVEVDKQEEIEMELNETKAIIEPKQRPDSLILNTATIEDSTVSDAKKYLYRSQSTRSFKKPKSKPSKILSSDLDQIYVISSNTCKRSDLNDFYDSIEVITERRSKNFMEFNNHSNSNNNCSSENKIDGSCENVQNGCASKEIIVEVESHHVE
ncbi:hypothetical protein ACKWTF_003266 [Chironomus riparius]